MYKIKIKDVYKDFSKDKEMSDFRSYSAKSRCLMIQTNQLLKR